MVKIEKVYCPEIIKVCNIMMCSVAVSGSLCGYIRGWTGHAHTHSGPYPSGNISGMILACVFGVSHW